MSQSKPYNYDVIIIGAGLSGLLTAEKLQAAGVNSYIVEARERLGGRILSYRFDGIDAGFDVGPTWYWADHSHTIALLNRFGISSYQQYESGRAIFERDAQSPAQAFPPDWRNPISYRVTGGMQAMIEQAAQNLLPDSISMETVVSKIRLDENGSNVLITTENGRTITSKHVVVTLPPHLAATKIEYDPALPADALSEMSSTPTWMGHAMKVVVVYATPFWRAAGLSGFGLSYAGPVAQFHDATPDQGQVGALFGWIGDHSLARQLKAPDRKSAVIAQIAKLFGEAGAHPLAYGELNWAAEPYTTDMSANSPTATEHPQYGHPLLRRPHLNGRLHWASTESSPIHGGYLDGAIFRAGQVADELLAVLENQAV